MRVPPPVIKQGFISLSVIWRILHECYNFTNIVSTKFVPIFSVNDYFVGILGGFQWAILMLELLTCKCNPQYSTRSFQFDISSNGGDWGGPNPFPVAEKCWGVGPGKFHESNPTDLLGLRWKL